MVKESLTFDRDGNEVEKMRRSSDGKYSRTVFQYDDRDRCVQANEYRDGKLFATTNYRYKFDAFGNWVSQTAFVTFGEVKDMEPIPRKIVFREISYY